ncbi:MAG: glycosyltransferase family 4 protein, partial [Candidatus Dormibacteraeota bacterium]|nr:glycosyltransferase family 4 protein [Candidatus Dormibacteraeota bacterium]
EGWALFGSEAPDSVELVLNGQAPVAATLDIPRLDVAEALNEQDTAADCGWRATIDLSAHPDGPMAVEIMVTRGEVRATLLRRQYTLQSGRLIGAIDEPRDGALLAGGFLSLRGWATLGRTLPPRLAVLAGTATIGYARLRIPHGEPRESPLASLAGFEFQGDLNRVARDADVEIRVALPGDNIDGALGPVRVRSVAEASPMQDERVAAELRSRTQRSVRDFLRTPIANATGIGRLLVFTHDFALAGAEVYLERLLRDLRGRIDQCTVVASRDGPIREHLEAMGVDTVVTGQNFATEIATYEGQVRTQSLFAANFAPDVVLANTLESAPAVDAVTRMGLPCVWSIHESYTPRQWLLFCARPHGTHPYVLERLIVSLRSADRFVFASKATASIFEGYTDEHRMSVLPYGIDFPTFEAFLARFDRDGARHAMAIAPDDTVVLMVGTVSERKAQATAVEAFGNIAERHENARLVIVGDVASSYSDAVHRLIAASGTAGRITVQPLTTEVLPCYGVADLLLSAADIESLPITILEAMAARLPVLSTRVFGVPEAITDGVNGWLFGPRDLDALSAALDRVLSMPQSQRQTVGLAAQETVRSHYQALAYADAFFGVLQDAQQPRASESEPALVVSEESG